MPIEHTADPAAQGTLAAKNVYVLAVIFLAAGLGAGYLLTGSPGTSSHATNTAAAAPASPGAMGAGHAVTMADMKQMADKQAAPLLDKLKNDPGNVALLTQVAAIYHISHQFSDAAAFYGRASQADPANVGVRTKFAISLYRSGDVDGAIAQLNRALSYDPKDANCLFNLGMIRLQGKGDSQGALAAWQQLLQSNPQLSPDRKAAVQQLIAQVLQTSASQPATGGARNHDGHKSSKE
ncbi:MAG TPA: tetratricopeptide repeat protein [Acidobacteriaceae bacterium]|jgi:cytochrome c-type biogenesis protein CcmH/NrfG|nr:tetratricopeptide repeat protein [Acidobacteriaceae bacterium]